MSDGGTVLARAYRYRSAQHIQAFATLPVCPLPNSINHNRVNSSDQTWTTQHWNIFGSYQSFCSLSVAPTRTSGQKGSLHDDDGLSAQVHLVHDFIPRVSIQLREDGYIALPPHLHPLC